MIRPQWIAACALDAPDESEAQLTALDLAVRPPAKYSILKCLLACGATPTARVVLKLVRNNKDDGSGHLRGSMAAVRECFLGAVAASEWAVNPLIPGLNLSVALIEAKRQVLLLYFFRVIRGSCVTRPMGRGSGAFFERRLAGRAWVWVRGC